MTAPQQLRATVTRRQTPEERAAELTRFEREADRDRFHDLIRTSLECVGWGIAALALMGWAMHTNDPGWGRIYLYAGVLVGNAGIMLSLYLANQRAIARGDAK